MPPAVSVTLLCLLGIALLTLMVVGWRRRVRRTAEVPAPPPVPATGQLGEARTGELAGVYVSTTVAGEWLERVAAHGYGVRSSVTAQVFDAGVLLCRGGAPDIFLPRTALRAVGTSSGMAGKVVGGERLTVLSWEIAGPATGDGPPHRLDTGLRLRHPAEAQRLREAAIALIGTTSADGGTEETR